MATAISFTCFSLKLPMLPKHKNTTELSGCLLSHLIISSVLPLSKFLLSRFNIGPTANTGGISLLLHRRYLSAWLSRSCNVFTIIPLVSRNLFARSRNILDPPSLSNTTSGKTLAGTGFIKPGAFNSDVTEFFNSVTSSASWSRLA
ncbi:hypothetical protein HanRHA438_Chr12g0565751 [Helianthus annuus]|nr:hypothetical protein HanHA300_Chr12g0454451 [Helianthus annuus]KAJ0494530.1 hypothetical protein HanIR_Chr12g0598521 [Helianthus annuus]KAJ0506268.1 hypothetical protein HanHA89_Chr12g0480031 [Helianthus annuus]KAJ0675940.1 hypothetical protein HanLR1_Chr12g0456951 [Helianthus annuus]KAJ0867660.1 hypothetical protein HanRHA438_Chr12g0565751 [Helianthus annuus]